MDRVEKYLRSNIGKVSFSLDKDSEKERRSRMTVRFVMCN